MKIRFLIPVAFTLMCFCHLKASDLTIENIRVVNRPDVLATPLSVNFDIKWKNSWNNRKNHDAVWVFMKYGGFWNNHVKLKASGHKILLNRTDTAASPLIEVSENGLGFFIYPSKTYRGNIDLKLQILIDSGDRKINNTQLNGLSVHAIEMVYIPEGAFTLGSPDEAALKKAAFYKSDASGNPNGLIKISSESAIPVAPEQNALYYWSENELYNGDQKGPVPADFPKGFNAFYIMKYELTQGQYAAFLNTLPESWTYTRSPLGGRTYYEHRGGIRLKDGKYKADNPSRPMNYLSFTDGLAYTDWAALRPLTELEYEKAARGPSKPVPAEFVWGTNNYDLLERYVTPEAELIMANGFDESSMNDENRAVFGASYYWVMDLSGSLWEKVITIGNPIGRAFKGSHGDGRLDFGHATNPDWPDSDDEKGGFGYRGGGYYQIGTQYSDFNPHSPIGYRYYGAWSGGPRSIAYGYRAGRSATK
ncbi:SUMF1/EgtB/PvdO family nonheme iron enzyme [Leptobacterium flavescens]|uniref:SUMF1/EgtB/PvdO family nonheme iron enzyme n=1 Tax=Leptobacterium flavescens TaxID=472055 RepID=A0A6P0UX45_9FLAO|nr:SUMF1/EgtB/PvdO family nonheme iron enzyme [Leptobacterium flavescens]NER15016.1 SUMF1/EgtB/PvdO family nonheme iron enzyme [Leptobacterium flavescens]